MFFSISCINAAGTTKFSGFIKTDLYAVFEEATKIKQKDWPVLHIVTGNIPHDMLCVEGKDLTG